MTQKDIDYRKKHAVVPQLDFFNGGFDNIQAPPVEYTKFAAMNNVTKVSGGKIASGLFGVVQGAIHMGTGDFGYGLGKMISSTAKTATGVVDPDYLNVNKIVCETIREWEEDSWKERYFLSNFIPAEGRLGDTVCEQGTYDEFYCGSGHRFFENGDYFEGLFIDGRISQGIYIFANGARYLGCFDEEGYFTGLGTFIYTSGMCYYGNFENSYRHGVGACWYSQGAYVGRWENDVRHGDGFLKVIDDRGVEHFYEGIFENDEPVE